ncbi:MAG TPA: SHOCT domain-containing protein [Gemmatimonadales bacterium]|nr:SHOCT domain-containing protein [Gemmatimonadales bacterium]
MPDETPPSLKPISPARVAEELERLSSRRASGEIKPDEYEHRFARMVSELRDRRIDGNRADIMAAIDPLHQKGLVSDADYRRLLSQLGIV